MTTLMKISLNKPVRSILNYGVGFDSIEYFDKTNDSLNTRFKLNEIDHFQNKSVLDAGCGSGRYSQALKSLGAATVTGIDISPNSIEFAERHNSYPDAVEYATGSVWTCHSKMIALSSDLVMGYCITRQTP